ncbi:MAG: hypothetical protein DCF25_16635 [Leptolyngbya foveolarum]|uniref:MFS transporter n=1 Tax=Leptolyngbya foveolarum TaxID=47253 RepID=A0A2W4U7E5_9CYAN|nr:MAG: hypothetical protein DCF25_16635 [Leptolyngbya foveolarum]
MAVQTSFNQTDITTPVARRVAVVLLLTRLSIFITFLIWVIDKFARPDHATAVIQAFYGLGGV